MHLGRRPQRVAHNTHSQNQKTLYGAGTKGLFAQWPFALQWGVAGVLGPEQGHKHQTWELNTEGGGGVHVSVCMHAVYGYVGCNTPSDAKVKINIFKQTFVD